MKAELQQLIALQNLDASIRRLQVQIEATPLRRAEIEKEFDQRAFEIRALENRRDEARHTRTRLEAEVMEQRTRAERADRNLMSSKKQEEYTAAIREADANLRGRRLAHLKNSLRGAERCVICATALQRARALSAVIRKEGV